MNIVSKKYKLSIIGLGYVGLPLAVEFGKKYSTIGFDISKKRIDELSSNIDSTLEINEEDIENSKNLKFSNDINEIKNSNIYIITVPTPLDINNNPDLSFLKKASEDVGNCIRNNDIIIYESTVYPGLTEEFCVPILEKYSKLKYNKNFFVGYSPERINPGDKNYSLKNICKIVSGSNHQTTEIIDYLYSSILNKGTFKVSSIKVAEAAKAIENAQRDINIAFMNELSIIFKHLDIDTEEVIKAAKTKWNFTPYHPGLVGGHCVAVDPYYLTYKAKSIGYNPKIILAGRKINDDMSYYVAKQLNKLFLKNNKKISGNKVLIMGFTFKENCSDIRNTRVYDLVNELIKLKYDVEVYDPFIDINNIEKKYKEINFINKMKENTYDAIVLAVAHKKFIKMGIDIIKKSGKINHLIYDLRYVLPKEKVDLRL